MAPKRWAKPSQASGPTTPEDDLCMYIHGVIRSNNVLGVEEAEMEGLAKNIATCNTRDEVFSWCTQTLMLEEAVAAEVIKRRTTTGPPFEGESLPPGAAEAALAAATMRSSTSKSSGHLKVQKKRSKRGVDITQMSKEKLEAAALKPGRFQCGCFATKHNLRGNCSNCGRIICEQEADDVCYHCGFEPSRCIAYEIAVQEGQLSEAAQEKNRTAYEAAISRRDQLLEYARNRAKRTAVIDDQSASLLAPQSAWMSPTERQEHHKSLAAEEQRKKIERMHKYKGAYQIHLDFVTQNVSLGARHATEGGDTTTTAAAAAVNDDAQGGNSSGSEYDRDDDDDVAAEVVDARVEPIPTLQRKIWYSLDGSRVGTSSKDTADDKQEMPKGVQIQRYEEVSRRVQQNYFEDDMAFFAAEARDGQSALDDLIFSSHNLDESHHAGYDDEESAPIAGSTGNLQPAPGKLTGERFAPTPLMLSRDEGVCLSMHQPWASLLVAGIKTHEGRVWDTKYRGKLWIHAASAEPQDVTTVEQHYAQFMSPGQSFPTYYPTKVLLGYVYLTDCLDQDGYEAAFAPEERQEGSPFSFICTNARTLAFPLPMDGNHKLFPLDRKVHIAAKKQLGEI